MSFETFCTKCNENTKLMKQVFLENGGETGYKCKCGELYIDPSTIAKAALKWKEEYSKYPIYKVYETGIGHWTDTTSEDKNAEIISISEAIETLKTIGTDVECSEFEGNIEYYMIYNYNQVQGIPGLYIPVDIFNYLIDNCPMIYNEKT